MYIMKEKMKGGQDKKKMENKTKAISLVLASIMLTSILAAGFALAETETEVDNESALTPSTDTSVVSSDIPTGYKQVGLARATYGQGYAISGDIGYTANVIWASHTFSRIAQADLQAIREQYKGNKTAMEQALKEAAKEQITKQSAGKLQLGIGKGHENFKLNLTSTSADNKTVSFDVLTIDSKEKVGTLSLTGKTYSDFTLWTGTLVLDSGDKAGTYSLSLASKTALIKNPGKGQGNGQGKEGNAENQGQGKKKGFWQNVFSFGRNKNKPQQ